MKWNRINECINTATISGITTNALLTNTFVSMLCPILLRVDASVSAVTVVGSVTMKLQHEVIPDTWVDVKTLAITSTGTKSITINSITDAALLPLAIRVRVVVTNTNAGDSVKFDNVYIHRME